MYVRVLRRPCSASLVGFTSLGLLQTLEGAQTKMQRWVLHILVWAPSRVCNSPTRAIPLSSRLRLRRQIMSAAERAKARSATTCARHARRLPTGSSLPIARALAPHLPLGCAHDPKAKGRPLRPSPPPSAPCAPQPSLSLAHAHSSLPLLRGTHPGIIRPRKAEGCRYSGPHGHKNIYISHSCHPDRVPF